MHNKHSILSLKSSSSNTQIVHSRSVNSLFQRLMMQDAHFLLIVRISRFTNGKVLSSGIISIHEAVEVIIFMFEQFYAIWVIESSITHGFLIQLEDEVIFVVLFCVMMTILQIEVIQILNFYLPKFSIIVKLLVFEQVEHTF